MNESHKWIVGIDEVGRGPLAGPVSVAAFCIEKRKYDRYLAKGLKNSKALTPRARAEIAKKFYALKKSGELDFVIASVSERIIDQKGIVYAIHSAIETALGKLGLPPEEVLVLLDGGIRAPAKYKYQKTIIKGDEKHPVIAAASIVAKVHRDRYMVRIARRYPEYGFEQHKGYGTRAHYEALSKYGLCQIHRKTYLTSLL